jgi:signal transduction histidine kinase
VLRTRAGVALRRRRTVDDYIEIIGKMGNEAGRLGAVVDGLLLLAAADEDRLPVRKQQVFLDDLLVKASELARTMAVSKNVALDLGEFQEAPVDADPELVEQLLLVLLENAVKYTPPRGRVRASVTADSSSCDVTIRDTGPGIAPEILPHVFERFYRADPSRARQGGSGLGLAIARSIADAHGADLSIDSSVGEGTTVRVSFPRRITPMTGREA